MIYIERTSAFKKKYKRIPKRIKQKAKKMEVIFQEKPFDARLRIHQLHGQKRTAWAYSIDHSYRIIFVFINKDTVLYLDIGTHEIYK